MSKQLIVRVTGALREIQSDFPEPSLSSIFKGENVVGMDGVDLIFLTLCSILKQVHLNISLN